MIKVCPADFSWKYISRIIGNLKMPVYASIIGINPTVVPLAKKAFTLGSIKVIVGCRFL